MVDVQGITNLLFIEIQKSHVLLYIKQQQDFETQVKDIEKTRVKQTKDLE